jgi:hypothetical protein
MQNNQQDITPEQSLRIITSMIETTKHNISDSSHFFLLWGYATSIGCLLQYILFAVVRYKHHYYAWFITIVATIIHFVFLRNYAKKEQVKTFVGEANSKLWAAMAMAFFAVSVIFTKMGWQYCYPIFILLYGIGTYVSGNLIQFKPLIVGGFICIFLAAVTAYLPYDLQMLMMAIAIIISYIVPGHLLRQYYQNKKLLYGTGKGNE